LEEGLISLLSALCSIIWAAHPLVLEITKIGVKKLMGIPDLFKEKLSYITERTIEFIVRLMDWSY